MECPICKGKGTYYVSGGGCPCEGFTSGGQRTCHYCNGHGKVRRVYNRKKYGDRTHIPDKGGCFITTATCQNIQGLDRSETILNNFRFFRDNWLSSQNNGLKYIESYYEISPHIVERINIHQDKDEIYKTIWREHLSKIHNLILSDKNKEAFKAYYKMVKWLEKI